MMTMAQETYGVLMLRFALGHNSLHQAGHHQVLLQVEIIKQYSIGSLGCHCS